MKRFDANCFCGNWPFFRVKENTVDKMQNIHKKYSISGGCVSSLEAIFYQDPYEAEAELAWQLQGTNYYHIMVLNPMLPAWREDLKRCVSELHIQGIRLLPGIHRYSLQDPLIEDVIAQAHEYNLPIFVTLRMHDDRTGWMLTPLLVKIEDVAHFLKRCGSIPVVLNQIRASELEQLNKWDVDWDLVFADTSGFKDGINPIQPVLDKDYLAGHIIYGSGAPLMETYATILQLELSDFDETEKESIFSAKPFLDSI